LGLPPDLPVKIDDRSVAAFQFIDPELSQLRTARVNALTEQLRMQEDPSLETIRNSLEALQALLGIVGEQFESVRQDFKKMDAVEGQRLAALSSEKDRKAFLDQVSRLKEQNRSLETRLAAIRDGARKVREHLTSDQRKQGLQLLVTQYEDLSDLLLELGFNQAGVRLEAIVLPPIKLDSEQAFQIALANRLDIMNQRADVVDQWRLIEFQADRLEADLNVQLNGSIGTLDRNIVKFRDQAGAFSASVSFDTPITRLNERNLYREALISYQRARRNYIQYEDSVKQGLRSSLRTVRLFEQEIELRREAMRIATRQMDFNQARLKEPPRVGAAAGAGGDAVRDLLGAFSDFLATQDGVMNTYLTYQALRMTLYRDLGIVRFDDNGMWIDEPLDAALRRLEEEGEPFVPPPVPGLARAVLESEDGPVEEEEKRPAPTVILSPAILTNPEDEPVRQTEASSGSVRRLTPNNKS